MSDEPIFYDKNYVDKNCDIIITSADATKYRIYDKDNVSVWKSSGQNSDSSTVTIEITFKENGVEIPRRLTHIMLQNINALNGVLDYKVAAGWTSGYTSWNYSNDKLVDLTSPNWTMFKSIPSEIAAVDVYGILITISVTRSSNAEKEVGEIWALKSLYTPTNNPEKINVSYVPVSIISKSIAGDYDITPLRWAGNRVARWSAKLQFSYLSTTDRSTLIGLAEKSKFVIRPEPVTLPNEIYQVTAIDKDLSMPYSSDYKTAGYSPTLEVREV